MAVSNEGYYRVQLENGSQVDDMRDFWRERIVHFDTRKCTVEIKTDRHALDQFMMFYDLYCVSAI